MGGCQLTLNCVAAHIIVENDFCGELGLTRTSALKHRGRRGVKKEDHCLGQEFICDAEGQTDFSLLVVATFVLGVQQFHSLQ